MCVCERERSINAVSLNCRNITITTTVLNPMCLPVNLLTEILEVLGMLLKSFVVYPIEIGKRRLTKATVSEYQVAGFLEDIFIFVYEHCKS